MTSLYRRTLGPAFDALPPALRQFHGGPGRWRGEADLTRGRLPARLAARFAGYPDRAGRLPLTVTITETEGGETWHRDFDGHGLTSRQTLDGNGRILERIGPASVLMRLRPADHALRLDVEGLRVGLLPLPPLLSGGGVETADGEAVRFDVRADLPGVGLLIRYRGVLHPV